VRIDFSGSAQNITFSSIEPACAQDQCQYQSNYYLSGGEDKPFFESETVYVSSGRKVQGPYVEKGQMLMFETSGIITLGILAGKSTPAGIDGFTIYNEISGYRHGQLLMRVGNYGNWRAVSSVWGAESSGNLYFMVNDSDDSNNSGRY
jgi:hypothetical protein